ncbi:family 16 glycosylhydrolase [Kitasatospora sp. NPDC088134]|uniref:glycoside hydrolase family 16 protein n=1 Tax=Kitasatospora sp. NPDC088134 TaxID=3364071 RepID=UPI00381C5B1E
MRLSASPARVAAATAATGLAVAAFALAGPDTADAAGQHRPAKHRSWATAAPTTGTPTTAVPTPTGPSAPSPNPTAATTSAPAQSPAPSADPTTPLPSRSPFATPTASAPATPSAPSAPSATATPRPTASTTPTAGGTVPGVPTWQDDFTAASVPLGGWTGCSANGPLQTSHCTGLPAAVDAKWWAYPSGWKDTSKNGTYDPARTLSIADGQLNIHLNRDGAGTWVAAPTPKLPQNTTYGTYEVTWKATCATGYKVAWLLWPDSYTWPRDGEIDFPEGDLCGNVGAFMHRQGATAGSDQDAYNAGTPVAGAWHVSRIEWQANDLKFYLDGKLIGHSTSRVPNTPMHWVLQSETALGGTTPAVGSSADITIDSVRFWKAG